MSTLRRELSWAVLVLLQLAGIGSLTALGGLLLRFRWFEQLFRIPGEAVLLPAWLGIALIHPVAVAMSMGWIWQLACRARARPPRGVAIAHAAGALLGALASFEWIARGENGSPVFSPALLIPSVPLAMLAFALLSWPRLVFSSLRPLELNRPR